MPKEVAVRPYATFYVDDDTFELKQALQRAVRVALDRGGLGDDVGLAAANAELRQTFPSLTIERIHSNPAASPPRYAVTEASDPG